MTWLQRLLHFLFGAPSVPPPPDPTAPSRSSLSVQTSDFVSGGPEFSTHMATGTAGGGFPAERAPTRATGSSFPGPLEDPEFTAAPITVGKPKIRPALSAQTSDFLPISREDLQAATEGKSLFGNPWFGRRDLIPPADDPRTKLIDRAMVTHGLLSPEELVEIHTVGDEMDRVRPTLAAIEHQVKMEAEAAVQADRDARARLKAMKKEEAAERKRRRQAAIAHRRATDILFLGRGVSARLGDRQGNTAALEAIGLPIVSTPAELAYAFGVSVPTLRWLAFHTEVASRMHYVQFEVPKRGGGTRTLSAPHRILDSLQRWVLEEILRKLPAEAPSHGFVAGRSILTNATPHARKAVVLNMDLERFFPSIGFPRVRSVFQRLGYSPAVATILALLCTECPRRPVVYTGSLYYVATGPRGLPQGACTSPAISNQVARRLDKRLAGLARKLDVTYTRYADDLTLSGDTAFNERVGYAMARVRHIAQDEGFAVNGAKTRVLRRGTAQMVTGLVVNERPSVRRREIRQLRAILHRARAEGLSAQNRAGRPNFESWLEGKIAFVAMTRPEIARKLRAELARIRKGS
jgi:retron-type reverse transcriptase